MIYNMKEKLEKAAPLFAGMQDTSITSCLQGIMGAVYADDTGMPESAMAILGDFCFFAGKPKEELVAYKPAWRESDFIIMVPGDSAWAALIEAHYGARAKKVTRYAIKKEPDVFDRERLREIVAALPGEYTLKLIDEELYDRCLKEEWSRDFVAQYSDYAAFKKGGLGVIALKDGEMAAGASSYSSFQATEQFCNGGIEVEIVTKEEHRRKGLALVCGAKLVLECVERGLYPSWDARIPGSVALAEKLGYHFDYAYDAYDICGY